MREIDPKVTPTWRRILRVILIAAIALLILSYLSGCAYTGVNDPNIVWPIEWQYPVQDNYVTNYCDYRA